MAFPEIRLIKSPRLTFISCNLRYLKFICPSPSRNKSYKPDFMQRVAAILIDYSFVFLYEMPRSEIITLHLYPI